MENLQDILTQDRTHLSFEVFPPKGDLTLEDAREMTSAMAPLRPDFISVTYSAAGSGNGEATTSVAAMIQDEFDTPSVAHLTCINATEESIQQSISEMKARGINTVLALRGDRVGDEEPPAYRYAKDLIPVLKDAGFTVGAAAYPEGHITCENAEEGIRHLKEKQDAGADFFVTQLAFDNDCILSFLDHAAEAGIDRPICCGIMPFMSKSQIQRMVFMCGASLPAPVIKILAKYENDPEALRKAGIEHACQQFTDLAREGVKHLHVYSMNRPDVARSAVTALQAAGFLEK